VNESIRSLIRDWPGLAVVARFDATTKTWVFIAMHDDTLGTPVGGTRLKSYPTPADALIDAMRLAEGMTHKWAAMGLDSGGGKAVLAVPGPLEPPARRGLLLRYGRLLETLSGAFSTGRDLGTTDEDMLVLAEVTRHVHGVDREHGTARDPGPFTAAGVLAAMRATARRLFDSSALRDRSVLVQGVGGVGLPLAHRLAAEGARLMLSDVDDDRVRELAARLGAEVVDPEQVYDAVCDLYAPCAIGATLNEGTIARLRCRAVVGSANNQLGEEADADRLHGRGILYAPDYVANSGGALAFGSIHRGVTDETELARRVDAIERSMDELYAEAAESDEPPQHAARRRVQRELDRRRVELPGT
jgi:leucine dehydrogenase